MKSLFTGREWMLKREGLPHDPFSPHVPVEQPDRVLQRQTSMVGHGSGNQISPDISCSPLRHYTPFCIDIDEDENVQIEFKGRTPETFYKFRITP